MKLLSALLVTWLCCVSVTNGEPSEIKRFKCRFGTLEIAAQTYIFRCGEEVEQFDVSAAALASGQTSGWAFGRPGPVGTVELGFRSSKGELFKFGSVGRYKTFSAFLRNHDIKDIKCIVLQSVQGEQWLEVNMQGKTRVCRVDLEYADGRVTLWTNIPDGVLEK
jgi:hypothetical protein